MKKITFKGKSLAFANKGLWLLCAGVMSFGVYAQKVPGRASVADERWQKGGLYAGYTPQQEVLSLRTKNAKHFKNANGSITAQVGGATMHYLDNNGAWQDVSRTIVRGGNAFVNETNSFKSTLPLSSGSPVVMKLNGAVNFEWWSKPQMQFLNNGTVVKAVTPAKVAGTAAGTKVQYKGIYANVTEEFVMLNNGIENNTIINALSADMAAMPATAVMQMKQFIPLKAGWNVVDANGKAKSGKFETESFQITIPGTEEGIYFGAIVAFDNALTKDGALGILATPENKRTAAQNAKLKKNIFIGNYTINFVEGGIEVAANMPVKWLKEIGRAYPVTIDPTVTVTPAGVVSSFRAPLSHWWGFQRHADLYLSSELNIAQPSQITAIEYLKSNTAAERTKPTTVYLKGTSATTLTGAAWNSATYTGGLSPVFDGNTTQDATTGWKMVTFTTPYNYIPGNLIVMVKDVYGGSGAVQYFDHSNTVTGRQAYSRVDTNDPGEGATLAVENYLPSTRFTYFPLSTTCAAPQSASIDGVTATAGTFNWVAPTTAPADGYEYVLSTSSTAPADNATPTGVTAPGVTTVNLTLSAATTYYAYVRSVCGTDKSYWVSASATTPCATVAAPFLQEFTNGTLPNCWGNSSATNVANTLWKFAGAVDYASGNTRANGTFAWVDGSDPSAGVNDVTLTTPAISLSALTNPELVFDYFSNSGNTTYANNIFTVLVFNGASWDTVYTNDTNSATWRTIRVPLASYLGTDIRVRFMVDKTAAAAGFAFYNDILLDNVSINETPACLPPVTPVAIAGANDVTLEWGVPSAVPSNGYEYEVRSSGAAGSGATGLAASGVASSATVTASGLAALTSYTAYIRSNCGATTSTWVSVTFNTVPANDNCDGAIEIVPNADFACGTVVAGSTVGATLSMAAAPCFGNPDDDVWFHFTATATSHKVTLSNVVAVTGTSTDMYFQVLEGGCGGETSLLCSDPNTNDVNNLVPGETYLIRVYSYGNTSRNTFNICVGTPPPPPANDDCEGAVALTVNAALTCTATTNGTTQSATNSMEADPCLGNPDDDVWFSFVATGESHRITLSGVTAVSGTSTDMYFQVLEGVCGTFSSLLCSDPNENVVSNLVPGETYYVRVYSYAATSRQNFTICVTTLPAPPANDECEGAIALTVNTNLACAVTTPGTTLGATNTMEAAPCTGTPDDDVFFSFVATGEVHRITLSNVTAAIGTSTSIYFQVLEGICGTFDSKLCSTIIDNSVSGLVPGETYYIRVYSSAAGAAQNFNICVGTPPPPPANDNCENAIALTVNADMNCGVTTAGTTAWATNSMAATPCFGNPDDDVFFSFVATAESHRISLSNVVALVGTSTDMYFQVLAGDCGTFESLLCSDPNSNTVSNLVPGETYLIRVYSYAAGAAQSFNICVGTLPAAPANDECAAAIALTVNPDLNCGSVTPGSTYLATLSMAATPCLGNPDDDVWFSFVATATSHQVALSNVTAITGTSTDMYFQVLEGACGQLTSKLCSDPNTNTVTGLTVGQTYYIRVYGYGAAATTAMAFNICVGSFPPPPVNDDCATSTVLTPGGTFDTNPLVGTNGSATNSVTASGAPTVNASCGGYGTGGDVWYSAVVPASGSLTIETRVNTGSNIADTVLEVYSGTCGTLTYIICNDDITTTTNLFSRVALTGRTPGETIYARVWEYGNDVTGTFRISAFDASLSTGGFDLASFTAYPNPVKDVLNIAYSSDITSVAVYNMLGQQVLSKQVNATEAAVDMSQLADGPYVVNVTAGDTVKTLKIVKKQ